MLSKVAHVATAAKGAAQVSNFEQIFDLDGSSLDSHYGPKSKPSRTSPEAIHIGLPLLLLGAGKFGTGRGRDYFFLRARIFAHRAFCAATMFLLPAADNFRLPPDLLAPFAVWFPPPSSKFNT